MAKLPDGVVDDPHSACKDESEQLDGQKGTLFSGRAFAAAKLLHESSGDQDTRVRLRAPGKASPPWWCRTMSSDIEAPATDLEIRLRDLDASLCEFALDELAPLPLAQVFNSLLSQAQTKYSSALVKAVEPAEFDGESARLDCRALRRRTRQVLAAARVARVAGPLGGPRSPEAGAAEKTHREEGTPLGLAPASSTRPRWIDR